MSIASRLGFAFGAGSVAGALSAVALACYGRRDTGSTVAPLNAPSHWVWGEPALHCRVTDLPHTALGSVVHWASSVFWGCAFEALRRRRRRPDALNAAADAAVVTALAAVVDLRVVPRRLSPGFERQLSRGGLFAVYACFAVGLAAAGVAVLRR